MRRWSTHVGISLAALLALGAGQDQRPAFRGSIDLVRVDVIVTGDDGRFVGDLGPDDFRVFEDGREQQLLDLQLVDLRRGVVQRAATNVLPEAELEDFMLLDGDAAARDASEFGAIVFLIDGTSIDMRNKSRFVAAWREAIDDTESLQVPRAAYIIDSDRRIRQIAPFTSDTARLREAADDLDEIAAFGNSISQHMAEVARHVAELADEPGVGMQVDALEADEMQRSYDSLRHLTQFSRALGSRPGRKALVWVSAGVKLTDGGPYSAVLMEAVDRGLLDTPTFIGGVSGAESGNPAKEFWGKEFSDYMLEPMLVEAQEELHKAANSSNVSIYALDPTQRWELRQAGQMVQGRTPMMVNLMGSGRVQSSLDSMRDALREAADQTGGRAFIHWSELPQALAEIEEDTSRFYLLAYEPPSPEDGEYHEISVEVTRPDLSVRQRRGYLALASAERTKRAIAAALQLPGATNGLDVSAQVFRKWNTVGEPLLQLAVSIDGASPVIRSPTGADALPLRVMFVALDDQQRNVRRSDQEVLRRVDEGDTGDDGTPFVYFDRRWWSLDPGTYDFRVAVLDPASGHIGATQVAVEVPERSIDWRTSDLILGIVDEAGSTQPLVGGRAAAGSSILAFAEVYGGASPVASIRVLRPDEHGETGGEPWAAVAAEALPRYVDNIHRSDIQLPRFLGPGSYVIELVVVDFTTRNETVLRAPLDIY